LSSLIFRQPTKPPPSFQNLMIDWKGFWNTLDFILILTFVIGLATFWNALSLILFEFWSSWVYCWTVWSLHKRSS